MGTVFRTLFFFFVMACACNMFSFVTLDSHCPSTGHKDALVFVVCVEKRLDICNKKLVVQQTSGKEFYWSMGGSSGRGPLDGWEFQALIIITTIMWSCFFTLFGSTLAVRIAYPPKSHRCLMTYPCCYDLHCCWQVVLCTLLPWLTSLSWLRWELLNLFLLFYG